jgi:long-subunit fatty acid transport protein
MIKKIIVSLSLLFSLVSLAQEGTSSPYSFYGLGDVRFKGSIENRSMGGLSVIPDSIHINLQNPALLSELKLTSLSVGSTFNSTKLSTNAQSEKAKRATLDYLAVGLPSKKFAFAFGIIPYSSVGYKIQNNSTITNPITKKFNGLGGINKAFIGVGYKLTKGLNIGADIQYNFGNIETKSITFIDGVQFGSREVNSSDISGVNFNTGIAYQTKINKKLSFFSSLSYSPESNLNLDNSRKIATIQFSSVGGEFVVDEQDIVVANSKLKMPSKFTFGSAFGEVRKWLVGADVTLQSTSNLGNRFNDIDNVKYENAVRYSVGGYFVPKYTSFNSYWNKVTFRGGFRYENTGLIINNKSVNDQAVSFGLGLPLSGTFSNINLGFEFGRKGTKDAALVEEQYTNISIGISFNDRWFQRRKID